MVMSLHEDQAGRENFNPVSERTLDKLQTSVRLDSAGRAERQDLESASNLKTNRDKMWASARVAEQTDDEDEHRTKGWKTG